MVLIPQAVLALRGSNGVDFQERAMKCPLARPRLPRAFLYRKKLVRDDTYLQNAG